MSDNAYLLLLGERAGRIDPDVLGDADSKQRILLYAPYHVPLLWLTLFSEQDICVEAESAFRSLDLSGPSIWVSCSVDTSTAISRLRARADYLSGLYSSEGGLAHHVSLFSDYLDAFGQRVVGLDLTELACNGGQPSVLGLREILIALDRSDPSARAQLDLWSTLQPGVRMISLDQGRGCSAEEMHNYFRVMGSGYLGDAPWD